MKKPELRLAYRGPQAPGRIGWCGDIVLADVCDEVELLDPPENLAPLMAQANAYLSIAEAGDEEAERWRAPWGKRYSSYP